MPADEGLTLCHNGLPVGRITGVALVDWPWLSGRFVAGNIPPELRAAIQWLAQQADADELTDPPFDADLLEKWTVVVPTGAMREIGVPLIDFATGTIEFR
ncbi:MAG: hypothetical protein U0804_23360 [Gemmataceae bacterium]